MKRSRKSYTFKYKVNKFFTQELPWWGKMFGKFVKMYYDDVLAGLSTFAFMFLMVIAAAMFS